MVYWLRWRSMCLSCKHHQWNVVRGYMIPWCIVSEIQTASVLLLCSPWPRYRGQLTVQGGNSRSSHDVSFIDLVPLYKSKSLSNSSHILFFLRPLDKIIWLYLTVKEAHRKYNLFLYSHVQSLYIKPEEKGSCDKPTDSIIKRDPQWLSFLFNHLDNLWFNF